MKGNQRIMKVIIESKVLRTVRAPTLTIDEWT